MRKFKCPDCGATLSIKDDDREFAFCEYCGSKILMDDYRSTHRIVDEAKIREADVREKEIECEREKYWQEKKEAPKAIVGTIIGLLVMIGFFKLLLILF